MRTTEKVLIEKEITTYKCDFCVFETKNNGGCCGRAPILRCSFCEKDMCYKHRTEFDEDGGDYYDFCVCPECLPDVQQAWDHAKEYAGRYDDICDVTRSAFKEIREQRALDSALRSSVEIVHPGRFTNDNN